MRIYTDFKTALNEIKRDIAEMGVIVHPQTMQNKQVAHDPNYETKELQNYIYCVTRPKVEDLNPTQPWADAELKERLFWDPSIHKNPGEAWKLRSEVWTPLLNDMGEFDYIYGLRMLGQIEAIIEELKLHPDSRQLFLSIWDRKSDIYKLGKMRVPCSLGYLFQRREGALHVTYLMRSADFVTHFENDLYLTLRLTEHIAEQVGIPVGRFTHFIGSLHVYQKDIQGVF
jgi:thymidylate synthase